MVLRKGGNFKFASERGGYPEKGGGGSLRKEAVPTLEETAF